MSDEVLLVLLPRLRPVVVESVAVVDGLVVVTARTRDGPAGCAGCAGCGRDSDREHSRYQRHVADEAVGGRPVSAYSLVCRAEYG